MRRIMNLLMILWLVSVHAQYLHAETGSSQVYERRVLPLLRSPAGSSCQECHFSGIELSDFLGEKEAETFAKLRSGGWIDVKHPEHSKLLTFVRRHGQDSSAEIKTLRQNELDALTAWIKSAVSQPELLSTEKPASIGIELDEALIRHLRRDRVLARFIDNVWSSMGRCINCHSPERNQRQVEEHGEQMSWIVPRDPGATLTYLRQNGLIDLGNPDESELRTKPTEIVEHGGGPKFPVGSASDKRFLAFLRDYAKVVQGGYKASDQLPKPSLETVHATENHLRLTQLPTSWVGKLVRVDLYAHGDDGWSSDRIATADSNVSENSQWQNIMQTVSPRGKTPMMNLVAGRYRARISIDRNDRLKRDPDAELSAEDVIGTVEFDGPWKLGWQEPKIVDVNGQFQ